MNALVDRLIAERGRKEARRNTDLLGRMLTGVDRQSGEGLPDDNIMAQCITFLIAGHETTSGLLSFAIYYLLKNPEVLARAQAEVDEVLGRLGGADLRAGAPARPTSGRCSTRRCGCGRRHPASPDGPSRTRSSGAATPSRRTPRSRC